MQLIGLGFKAQPQILIDFTAKKQKELKIISTFYSKLGVPLPRKKTGSNPIKMNFIFKKPTLILNS